MGYNEYIPHPALQNYIAAYWMINIEHTKEASIKRILPDSCTDIIFNKGSALYSSQNNKMMDSGQSYLVGTMKTFKDTLQRSGTSLLGIRFKPGGISAFYRLNLNEVTDRSVTYDDGELYEIVYKNKNLINSLNTYFLKKLPLQNEPFLDVIADIKKARGQIKVSDLISRHSMSERKLERLFKQHTGVSIVGMIRLERFAIALHTIRNNIDNQTLSQIACSTGYYDQAHLCNEVKSFTGLTPAQL